MNSSKRADTDRKTTILRCMGQSDNENW